MRKKICIWLLTVAMLLTCGLTGCGSSRGLHDDENFPAYVDTALFLQTEDAFRYEEEDLGKRSAGMVDQIYRTFYKGELDGPRWRDTTNADANSFLWGLGALQTMAVATYRAEPNDDTRKLMTDLLADISYYKPLLQSRLQVYLDDTLWRDDVAENRITPRLRELNRKVLQIEQIDGEDDDGNALTYARTKVMFYGSSPNGTDPYYDDNIWCVLAFLEASEAIRAADPALSASYFETASAVMRYCLSGWSGQMDGGIKWKDTHGTKNACINGPATLACTMFYDHYASDGYSGADKADMQEFYLTWAEMIYDWSNEYFRDPADGLYWDSVEEDENGSIVRNTTKFTYNTGTFLSAAVRLHRITGDERYKADADETQKNAYNYFISRDRINMPDIDIWPTGHAWFNVYLARGFMDYGAQYRTNLYVDRLKTTMDYAWKHARDYYGFIKCDWSGKTKTAAQNYDRIQGLFAAAGLEVTSLLDVYYNGTI